jgi:hypothetical protein
MASSRILRRVELVRTDDSEGLNTSIIRVIRIGAIGMLAVTSNRCTLRRNTNVVPSSPIHVTLMIQVLSSSETSVLRRATRHNITEGEIIHSYCHGNLKSYIAVTSWDL